MGIPLSRRDIKYTIVSRFEEVLRSFLRAKLEVLFDDYKKGIPPGVLRRLFDRGKDHQQAKSTAARRNIVVRINRFLGPGGHTASGILGQFSAIKSPLSKGIVFSGLAG